MSDSTPPLDPTPPPQPTPPALPPALPGPHAIPLYKVASQSQPASVAGAIAAAIREHGRCELQAIGAGAINQTVKAIAIARGYVAPGGIDLAFVPAFLDLEINGEERTALKFAVEPRRPA